MATVLVVDDHPALREAVAASLRRRGIEADVAADGREAIVALCKATAAGKTYDGLVLDISMPVVDGWQVLHAVKMNPLWKDIRVVVLTGVADDIEDMVRISAYDGLFVAKKNDFIETADNFIQRLLGL